MTIVVTPNATETVDSLSQPSPQFPPVLDSDTSSESAPVSKPEITGEEEEGLFQYDEDEDGDIEEDEIE